MCFGMAFQKNNLPGKDKQAAATLLQAVTQFEKMSYAKPPRYAKNTAGLASFANFVLL
jgi:hypothetical protein